MRRSLFTRVLSSSLVALVVWAPVSPHLAWADMGLPDADFFAGPNLSDIAEAAFDYDVAELPLPVEPEDLREFLPSEAPEEEPTPDTGVLRSIVGGEAKSAVTPQTISLPKAEGSIQGMGESFSPVLSSGTATFTVPIAVPPGRAGVQPALSLSYATSGGNGTVGFGWSLATPFISRQADRGVPRYVDRAAWHPQEDRFFFNGGQELVPVDSQKAETGDCGSAGCAPIPTELAGWQQYRARVEGAFVRFFRAPDLRRWVVQDKDGTRFDYGALPASDLPSEVVTASTAALASESAKGQGRVYRWLLTRMTERHGSVVYYLYGEDRGQRVLENVFYQSPHGACGSLSSPSARMRCQAPLGDYGRRVRLVYEDRADAFTSYVSGWAMATAQRLKRIEVTAATGSPGKRSLVRRYHLSYAADSFHSLLSSVQVEGRPSSIDHATGVAFGDAGIDEATLGESSVGPRLPPIRFGYTTQPQAGSQVAGFGGIDATVHRAPSSPPHAVDEARADLYDVNSDGLPDLVVTDPARYRTSDGAPAAGVFFNGFAGTEALPAAAAGTFSGPVSMALPSGLSNVLSLSNGNIVPMDIDGDGRGDLLHMPRAANYGYFTPTRNNVASAVSPAQQGWSFAHVPRVLPAGETDPRIDLSRDGDHIKAFDVNHDRLIDVVRTTGTGFQTWLNLGWLPGGDGRFGSYRYDEAQKTWKLSTEPVETCLNDAGLPVDFADPEVRLGDMNGDGLQDIVKIRKGRVIYWAGRGEGRWGEGNAACTSGLVSGGYVEMATPPLDVGADVERVQLADVNADGADDLVQIRFRDIDVWFNQAGQSFTGRVIARNTPEAPSFSTRTRLADVDGTGTVDVVFAKSGDWRWVDLMGGRRPRLLVAVDGGLGALTEIAYGSSVEDYLSDLRAAASCTSCERFLWSHVAGLPDRKTGGYRSGGSPVVSTVVRQVSTTDRLDRLGRPENRSVSRYAYHDAYYEGIEAEFRGFGAADATAAGDERYEGTSTTRSTFHQGRRPSALASDRLADNPDEALKAREYMTETFDTKGNYLSTSHTAYTVKKLHEGLNGVAVSYAYASQSDVLHYDTALPQGVGEPRLLPFEGAPRARSVVVRNKGRAETRSTIDAIDNVGNVLKQTKYGRVRGEFNEALPNETILSVAETKNLSCSETGWLWRTEHSFLSGHGDLAPLGEVLSTYNCVGDPLSATNKVTQSASLAFGGDGTAQSFGSPLPEDMVLSTTYDAWGNLLKSCSGGDVTTGARCLRYSQVDYDPDYATLPETESVAVGRGDAGFALLVTRAEWERGLSVVTATVDPNGDRSTVTYDGFGRFTSVTLPSVSGCSGSLPMTRVEYEVTSDPVARPLSRVISTTQTSCTNPSESLVSIAYVDGLGRPRAVLTTGDDDGARRWVKSGIGTLTSKGAPERAWQPGYYAGSEMDGRAVLAVPMNQGTEVPYTYARYDAFGRQIVAVDEILAETRTFYHALSTDVWDPLDLKPTSPHFRTPTTTRTDGHGRVIDQVLRNRGGSTMEYYRLWTDYRADGAVVRVERAETAAKAETAGDAHRGAAIVVDGRRVWRTFAYDSVGRRIATTDPDSDNPVDGATWRYLFNRVGDLAAVRDPRGCGQNYYYDHGGRLVAEAYVGCAEAQKHEAPAEVVPAGVIGFTETAQAYAAHVRHFFDRYAGTLAATPALLEDFPVDAAGVMGRQTGTADRGQRNVVAYDRRGNVLWEARQLALLPPAAPASQTLGGDAPVPGDEGPQTPGTVTYDETHTYVRTQVYDHANRAVGVLLPRDPDFDGTQAGPRIGGRMTFGRRGLPKSAAALIVQGGGVGRLQGGGIGFGNGATVSEQPVIAALEYARDGAVTKMTYGDDLGGTRSPTVTTNEFNDLRRVPTHSWTLRAPTGEAVGSERPLSAVTLPFDKTLHWDEARNLTQVDDNRPGKEWPAGHRPQSVELDHDSLYRVTEAVFSYTPDSGARVAQDSATDWRQETARTRPHDPMRSDPAPMVTRMPTERVGYLGWEYDWLGNMKDWVDDAHAFYERSIGYNIGNGANLAGALRPSALYLASDLGGTPADRGGYLELDYGAGGNVVAMTVHAQCVDRAPAVCTDAGGANLASRRAALRESCVCASEQLYHYRWDELNRLAEARRYDRKGGSGTFGLEVRQRYRYNGANQRTVKQTLDTTPELGTPPERVALSVYPGDFERRGLTVGAQSYMADLSLDTETQYLVAGARIVWKRGEPNLGLDADHRITVGLSDLIGTTSVVLDLKSGELVEEGTYYPNGARETYVTTATATVAPEPMGFTGKETDEEVGVTYFGERYLIPRIGRWASPDPLAIHALGGGEVMNEYHYVSGSLLQARDPIGLEEANAGRTMGLGRLLHVLMPAHASPYMPDRIDPLAPMDQAAAGAVDRVTRYGLAGAVATGGVIASLPAAVPLLAGGGSGEAIVTPLALIAKFGVRFGPAIGIGTEVLAAELGITVGCGYTFGQVLDHALPGVWKLSWQKRGLALEQMVIKMKGLDFELVPGFPIIDWVKKGVGNMADMVGSVKSINTLDPTYQKPRAVYNKVVEYIGDLDTFASETLKGIRVEADEATKRVLDLAVPRGTSPAQIQEIEKAVIWGKEKGIVTNLHMVE